MSGERGAPLRGAKPLLVGEANPYGDAPEFALYPYPEHSAGGRLCRVILGIEPRQYLRQFERRNLCPTSWSMRLARSVAVEISAEAAGPARPVVLLGARVCGAFCVPFDPFLVDDRPFADRVVLPHPSGRCRLWNEPGAIERARAALAAAGIEIGGGAPRGV